MADKSGLDWEEYEAITKYIYESLGVHEGIKVKGYGRKCKVKGKSGATYQIDVLIEQSDGERVHQTAIECKFLKKKVTNDTVMKLHGIMEDVGIESGIIVCKTGFTKDTLTYAEYKGIKLVELREAEENDADFKKTFEIGTGDFNFNVMLSRPKILSIDFGTKTINDEDQIMQMYFVNLHDSIGESIPFSKLVKAFAEELHTREEPSKTTSIDFPLNRKLFCELPEGQIVAEKISITGFLTKSDRSFKKSLVLTDQVWMIMNELFDKRKFSLSKSGLIWNLTSNS